MEENFFSLGYNPPSDKDLIRRLNIGLYSKILAKDLIADPKQWPIHWIQLLFTAHKNRRERYRLFVFLWKNGVPPDIAVGWVMYHGTVNRKFEYDRSAWSSMDDAVNETKSVDGRERLKRVKCLDLISGKID